jgi:hypothetical protein
MPIATITIRHGCWYIVDGRTMIALGPLSIPQAALKLHHYRKTWVEAPDSSYR